MNKMTVIIIGIVVLILIGMRLSCTGLWKVRVSKIPSNLLFKKEGEPFDYTRCEYIGFSGVIENWKYKYLPSTFKAETPPILDEISNTTVLHYKNSNPNFSFDYPNLEGYKITAGPNYINYDTPPSEQEGPLGAYIQWGQVYIKVSADYWDTQKVNAKGVRYNLSEDEDVLDFRLLNQGSVIRFDVRLPGGYLRKKQIIDTIIDSFEEGSKDTTTNILQ